MNQETIYQIFQDQYFDSDTYEEAIERTLELVADRTTEEEVLLVAELIRKEWSE